jgi:hypothetical protein
MNYFEISKNLLYNGAKSGIKTDQKLSSKAIARIQHNFDIVKLIAKKDSININPPNSSFPKNSMVINSEKQIPEIDFNLPFDKELAKKRHFNKIVQIISFPVFVFSAAGALFLKSEANHYYSLSKTAETEDLAKYYYDKTQQYDKNAYISGGISLISLYGFIHTTIRTKSISGKMLKTFN